MSTRTPVRRMGRRGPRWLAAVLIALLALVLRLNAVGALPIDFDEDDYLRAAQDYASALQSGDPGAFTRINFRPEHPPLAKLVFGLAIAPLPPAEQIPDLGVTNAPASTLPEPHLQVARLGSAVLGAAQVFVLALVNPLAGLFLAIQTWHIKYTSQVMLESLPGLTSLLCVLCYSRARGERRGVGWLIASAAALGLTAAGKYIFCVAGIAVALDWLWHIWHVWQSAERTGRRLIHSLVPIAAWGLGALAVFLLADPYLWPDPLGRLWESVAGLSGFAAGDYVRAANLPIWQPFVYLMQSVPWHPGVFPVSLDVLIAILAVAGLAALWQRARVQALWIIVGIVFLLIWPTKWPQYILIISAPLCLAAAEGAQRVTRAAASSYARWRAAPSPAAPRESLRALPWLLPGLIALFIVGLFPLVYQGAMALTDFNRFSIRDGITGGVWREVWLGLTGQRQAVFTPVFGTNQITTRVVIGDRGELRFVTVTELPDPPANPELVHYTGPQVLSRLLAGAAAPVLVFNLLWTVLSLAIQTVFGVAVALLVNRPGVRFRFAWRTLFIVPWAIPEFVGAIAWLYIFEPTNGLISLATSTTLNWRQDALQALGILLIANLWLGWPLIMLATTAGLRMISPEIQDAASVDGAGGVARFRHVTLPMLLPLLTPALVIRAVVTFNQFYLFFVFRPPGSMTTLAAASFSIFSSLGQFGGQFGVSAALNIFTVFVLVLFILLYDRVTGASATEGVTYA